MPGQTGQKEKSSLATCWSKWVGDETQLNWKANAFIFNEI